MTAAVQTERPAWYLNRWNQLILGVIAMMAISSPQYVWTLFTGPLNQKLGTTLAAIAVDLFAADHPADLALAVPGLSGRSLRPAGAHCARCAVFRRQLGALRLRGQYLAALFHLWRARRLRHRHHLCRHHRPDGALVSRPARARHRPGRSGLRLRRLLHQFPHRQHDQKLRLCAHTGRLGRHPGRDRNRWRRRGCACRRSIISRRKPLRPRRSPPSRARAASRRARCCKARCFICCS